MKKLNLFALLGLFLAGAAMTSCDSEDILNPNAGPSVEVTVPAANPYTATPGEAIAFTVQLREGSRNLDMLEIFEDGSVTPSVTYSGSDISTDELQEITDYVYTVDAGAADGSSTSVVFLLTQNGGLTDQLTFTINVSVEQTSPTLTSYPGVALGAQSATAGSHWNAADGSVYTVSEAGAAPGDIDIVFYYGASNANSLGAPDNTDVQAVATWVAGWGTQNATRFATLSGVTFGDITTEADLQAAIGSTALAAEQETQLAVNDVVVFETVDGLTGVLQVTDVAADGTGNITFDAKVGDTPAAG